ncbi:icln-1, partial [Pristionchus pacificus]
MLVLGEVSIPTQGVRLVQDQVVAYLNDAPIAGEGTLAVAESAVTWISRREGRGFSLSYPSIIMHAISTDVSSFPHEHVLVVADAGRADVRVAQQELAAGGEGGEGEGDEEESEDGNLILRFVPSDLTALDTIYKEMAECQELNPEEEDMEEDEDEEEEGEE